MVAQDRPDEAERALNEAAEQSSEDDAVTVIGIRRVRAKIRHRQGRLEEAEHDARDAIAVGEPTDYLVERADSHRALGEILVTKGERGEGLEHLRKALELCERKGVLVLLDGLRAQIAEVEAS
jgi:ATP/maltotriose-dependent transcriptional regulator MalT